VGKRIAKALAEIPVNAVLRFKVMTKLLLWLENID
jgi:hypothetical protein